MPFDVSVAISVPGLCGFTVAVHQALEARIVC